MIHLISLALASTLFLFPSTPAEEDMAQAQLANYPMDVCLITGEPLPADAISFVVDGQLLRTCCKDCARKVKAKPAEFVKRVQRAAIEQQAAHYPLKTCLKQPSKKLDDKAAQAVVGSRLVRACCERCLEPIVAKPAEYMKRLDAAYIEQQRPHYALKECLVSGEPLGEDTKDVLVGNTLVRVCCGGCKRDLAKDPKAALKKLAAASKGHGRGEKHGKEHGAEHGEGRGHDDGKGGHDDDGHGHGEGRKG